MGSSVRIDSERRELVRERRERIARQQQRRQARERKRSQIAGVPVEPPVTRPSTTQRIAQQRVHAAVDELVDEALDRREHRAATASTPAKPAAAAIGESRPCTPLPRGGEETPAVCRQSEGDRGVRVPHRDRDIAEFRHRRQQAADQARAEAGRRIARVGEPAAVADALAALAAPGAEAWAAEREQLEQALGRGQTGEVGTIARRALWNVARDAARSSRRATRDPDLAAAACVAYAIVARLPRTAVRSTERARPATRVQSSRRAFWR